MMEAIHPYMSFTITVEVMVLLGFAIAALMVYIDKNSRGGHDGHAH